VRAGYPQVEQRHRRPKKKMVTGAPVVPTCSARWGQPASSMIRDEGSVLQPRHRIVRLGGEDAAGNAAAGSPGIAAGVRYHPQARATPSIVLVNALDYQRDRFGDVGAAFRLSPARADGYGKGPAPAGQQEVDQKITICTSSGRRTPDDSKMTAQPGREGAAGERGATSARSAGAGLRVAGCENVTEGCGPAFSRRGTTPAALGSAAKARSGARRAPIGVVPSTLDTSPVGPGSRRHRLPNPG